MWTRIHIDDYDDDDDDEQRVIADTNRIGSILSAITTITTKISGGGIRRGIVNIHFRLIEYC
jgi:hypothetical protein